PQQPVNPARVDGANAWKRFWHVTVPTLRGVIIITSILLFVGNLNSFGLVWIMTGGGPANASQIWITQVYTLAFQSLQYGRASAYSVILFIVMLCLGYFYVRALTGSGRIREARALPDVAVADGDHWPGVPALFPEQHDRVPLHHRAGCLDCDPGRVRVLAVPVSGARRAVLRGARAQHVSGGRIPDTALHPDA